MRTFVNKLQYMYLPINCYLFIFYFFATTGFRFMTVPLSNIRNDIGRSGNGIPDDQLILSLNEV